MADDLSNRGGQDRGRISMDQEHEVRYWTQRFGVTRERLAEAVRQAGNSADNVQEFFARRS